jgi:hypothetical protein
MEEALRETEALNENDPLKEDQDEIEAVDDVKRDETPREESFDSKLLEGSLDELGEASFDSKIFDSSSEDGTLEDKPKEELPGPSASTPTPTKPPPELRGLIPKPDPKIESPICAKPAPFVLRPPRLPGPAQVPAGPSWKPAPPQNPPTAYDLREARDYAKEQAKIAAKEAKKQRETEKKTWDLNPFGKRATRSNTKIEGDPTREYLATRKSKPK